MLRVALVGNMNNGNFAAMRHLRGQGLDAHLLMYADEPAHFHPRHDTWQWESWRPFVHVLPVSNGGVDALLARPSSLAPHFDGFDVCMGNGFVPVFFAKLGRCLDLFLPYAEGVEFIIHHSTRWRRPLSTAFSWTRRRMMERALQRNVRQTGTANLHPHSLDTFRRLGIQPIELPLLALFREPAPASPTLPSSVETNLRRMQQSPLVVFSHVSHIWKNLPVPHFMGGVGKRNQILIQGFAEYVRRASDRDAVLCLFEYGSDVDASRQLIAEHGIADQVLWFPTMSRRDIMCLLAHADIGGSEFAGMYWGGCGWEFLSSGVPMLHQLDEPERYGDAQTPLAPFLNVSSASEIAQVLLNNDRTSLREHGAKALAWYEQHHGTALASRYVRLLHELHDSRGTQGGGRP